MIKLTKNYDGDQVGSPTRLGTKCEALLVTLILFMSDIHFIYVRINITSDLAMQLIADMENEQKQKSIDAQERAKEKIIQSEEAKKQREEATHKRQEEKKRKDSERELKKTQRELAKQEKEKQRREKPNKKSNKK